MVETLVQIRKQNGLTQAAVAERMGTTQSAVSDISKPSRAIRTSPRSSATRAPCRPASASR
ncbi:helix-turn-helix domain-containing protein [Thermobifida cellulosilytica]|uniref:helix-turn-helix domain-containing protein n=1 Tax=Thermobifida cellulosilytica TaxID=144786 RepID=UPI0009FDFBD8